jgi:hypothetical protein
MVRVPVAGWHEQHPGGRWCQPNGGDPAERPSDAPPRGSPPLHHVQDVRGTSPPARTFSATTSARRFRTVLAGRAGSVPPLVAHRPTRCPYDHELGPGRVEIGWMPCLCAPAREAADRGRGLGHLRLHYPACREQRRDTTFLRATSRRQVSASGPLTLARQAWRSRRAVATMGDGGGRSDGA